MTHKADTYDHLGPLYALDAWLLVQPVFAKMTLAGCVIVSFSAQLIDKDTRIEELRELSDEEKLKLRSWSVAYILGSSLRSKMGARPDQYFYEVRLSTKSDKVIGYHVILLTPTIDLRALIGDLVDSVYD